MSYRRVPAAVLVFAFVALVCYVEGAAMPLAQSAVALPNKPDTLHFAVIGDNGTGDKPEYEIGQQMANWYNRFQFPFVVMMGDNIYGSDRPQDFVNKFEAPYKGLLDKGVKFYASLGNHDSREQRYYKYFNMDQVVASALLAMSALVRACRSCCSRRPARSASAARCRRRISGPPWRSWLE